MDRSKILGEANISSLLLKFSSPAIVGMLAQALYNVVDRIFVGQAVGSLGITGTTIAFPFMMVVMAFGSLIGFGERCSYNARSKEPLDETMITGGIMVYYLQFAQHWPILPPLH